MKPVKPMTFGQRLLGIFLVGFLLGLLWPGGVVGGLFIGLGVFILACVAHLAWSLLSW